MALCVGNPLIIALLDSRRIDPLEVLASDEIRFWIEVWRGNELSRVLESAHGNHEIRDILTKHDIPERKWAYSVSPSPTKFSVETPVERLHAGEGITLEREGIFTGSTLRIRRVM